MSKNQYDLLSIIKMFHGYQFIKKAYSPEVKSIADFKEDGNFDKFGGFPSFPKLLPHDFYGFGKYFDEESFLDWLEDYNWPKCKYCKVCLTFFFQVTDPIKHRTYQMFMCTVCENENTAQINLINYDECYDLKDLVNGYFTETIDLDGSNQTKTYSFNQEFNQQIKKNSIIAYDHSINDSQYHMSNLNLPRDEHNKRPLRYFRGYRVTDWVMSEEVDIDPAILYMGLIESPITNKLPEWKCQCKYPNKDFSNIAKIYVKDYDESKQNLKGYECICFQSSREEGSIKFGGKVPSCQGISYPGSIFHFSDKYYLPYMWGDSGCAHIVKGKFSELKIEYDCC